MIWIEILSRDREVAARFRVAGPEVRIGRSYDNDVIADDVYVAARHLRVFRDEAGQLAAEDMGSANGTFIDGGKTRLAHFLVDGKNPIRIGRTHLRIRDSSHAVEGERIVPPERVVLPVVLAFALGTSLLGVDGVNIWLNQTAEPRVSSYLGPLLAITGVAFGWVGVWVLVSRILSGRSHFLSNLLIALTGGLALSLYNELGHYLAFAWTWSTASTYEYVATWSIVAAICFFHLRELGHTRLWLKGTLVAMLLAVAVAAQTLQRSEAFSDSGRQITAHVLMPPSLRAVPFRNEASFFGEVAKLKGTLDGDRGPAGTKDGGR